jgi:uncharacterized membrane protein YgaE (UPF0421/DUF939 family)
MLNGLKKILENHKKDILRLSLRSAVAAVITYALILYIKPEEAFLAILSAVLIIDFPIEVHYMQQNTWHWQPFKKA